MELKQQKQIKILLIGDGLKFFFYFLYKPFTFLVAAVDIDCFYLFMNCYGVTVNSFIGKYILL